MLYDQAMLMMAYAESFQATRKEQFRETVEQMGQYLLRDMCSPEGGFYSAEDADSEGVEGKFYVWTESEIREIVGSELGDLAVNLFNVSGAGNFHDEATREKTGANILHLTLDSSELAAQFELTQDEFEKKAETIREKIFNARGSRIRPGLDDKVLTDWNGLTIAALSKAAAVLDSPELLDGAKGAADFLLKKMQKSDGRLLHRYRGGEAAIDGYIDDYAFFVWGLIELYEASFDPSYLESAIALNEKMIELFQDVDGGGFFMTAADSGTVLIRPKEGYDGAIPSGNSVASLNLVRLARLTGNTELENAAESTRKAFAKSVRESPRAFTQMLAGAEYNHGVGYEVVLVGKPDSPGTETMLTALRSRYLPSKVVVFRPIDNPERIVKFAPYTEHQTATNGETTAYVCRNFTCSLPTTDPVKMLEQLGGN
jgi:uncharacterized protein